MSNRPLTNEELAEAFAEGMEAAHCGLFMKDGPQSHNGRRAVAWRDGYRQAMRDRGEVPAGTRHLASRLLDRGCCYDSCAVDTA